MKQKLVIKKLYEVCDIVSDSPKEFIGVKKYYSTGAIANDNNPVAEEVTFANRPSRANSYPKLNDVGFAKMKLTNKVILVDSFFKDSIFSTGFCFLRPKQNLNSRYLYHYVISHLFQNIKDSLAGDGIMGGIKNSDVKEIEIPLPSLSEQEFLVSLLDQSKTAIAEVKANTEQNLQNTKELFESYLQRVFENKLHGSKFETLDSLCELIVDCEHKTAPTQETGYPSIRTPNIGKGILLLEGVNRVSEKTYNEWTRRAIPQADDLILAREAPAGNIAVIPENVKVCLGQRTVLIRPKKNKMVSKFLAHLILSKDVQKQLLSHSTGATVEHINMKDIRAFKIYNLSPIEEQQIIVKKLDALSTETKKLETIYQQKLNDLEELKKSVLQKAFAGELKVSLTSEKSFAKVVSLQKLEGISTTDLQAGITAIALTKHIEKQQHHSFHHVKAEKIIHLAEYILNIDLERNPVKDAAGPNDFTHAKKVESRARKAAFYTVYKNGEHYDYRQGNSINTIIQKTNNSLGGKANLLTQIIDILIPMKTQQAEIVATVYAAWNNLILQGNSFTDEEIVLEARENWHTEKLKIPREKFFNAIEWMRKNEVLIPKGNGKIVGIK